MIDNTNLEARLSALEILAAMLLTSQAITAGAVLEEARLLHAAAMRLASKRLASAASSEDEEKCLETLNALESFWPQVDEFITRGH